MRKHRKKTWFKCLLPVIFVLGHSIGYRCLRLMAHTVYVPLSGRIFAIDPAEYEEIFIMNGTTGEAASFTTEEDKGQIAQILNDLRANFWYPALPIPASGGWSYRVALVRDGQQFSYYFGKGLSGNQMVVEGIVYTLPQEQSDFLKNFVE